MTNRYGEVFVSWTHPVLMSLRQQFSSEGVKSQRSFIHGLAEKISTKFSLLNAEVWIKAGRYFEKYSTEMKILVWLRLEDCSVLLFGRSTRAWWCSSSATWLKISSCRRGLLKSRSTVRLPLLGASYIASYLFIPLFIHKVQWLSTRQMLLILLALNWHWILDADFLEGVLLTL